MGFTEVALVFDKVGCLRPAEKLLLIALADRANGDGEAWPSVRELCRRSCQARSTVMRQLDSLRQHGLIVSESRRKRDEDGRSRQTSSLYRIDIVGIALGKYGENGSGSQNDTLKEKTRSESGSQNDTLNASGSQNPHVQGLTHETPINNQQNYQPSPQPPSADSAGGEPANEGAASPLGGSPDGDRGGEEFPSHEKSSEPPETSQSATQDDLCHEIPLDDGVGSPVVENPSKGRLRDDLGVSELVGQVLPRSMRAIPPRQLPRIASMIRERLDAGWTIETLHAALEARSLPSEVRNLSALVIARFRDDIPVNGAPPIEDQAPPAQELVRADGSPVKHYDLDWGLIAMDHKQARESGTTSAATRRQFVLESGVERYLLGT
ncbi:helix-turn-helix domain-containing protein [Corynebacterium callunae]|uniref:Helix-turn-helix domain-containing protein n=1 Tax=Corynebacterium callunae DSM 20147 TaxID=1121353 RepID=M1TPA9_9CORY|nr:helix-turn-helix domain-containing protein [Corynebacterium callunae]AGG66176.1 hypothetical protein H924_03640 [Corynebacterium callunae DSM 20147]